MPLKFPHGRFARGALFLGLLSAGVIAGASVSLASKRDDGLKRASAAVDAHVALTEKLAKTAQEVVDLQRKDAALQVARARAKAAADAAGCDGLLPRHSVGVGILQVVGVPARGEELEKFAANQAGRLAMLLKARNATDWSKHLMSYEGKTTEPIRRVVFNNVGPDAGRQMCAWLSCERWTGGCGFVDEKGRTNVPEVAAPEEFPASEDLYELWRMSKQSPIGNPPVVFPG